MSSQPIPMGTLGKDLFYINCKASKLLEKVVGREITATFFIEKRIEEQSNGI
jgi:hypothetical protein